MDRQLKQTALPCRLSAVTQPPVCIASLRPVEQQRQDPSFFIVRLASSYLLHWGFLEPERRDRHTFPLRGGACER